MSQIGLEVDCLDCVFAQGFIEHYAAVASDGPNQFTRDWRQGLEMENNAIAAFDLPVVELDHAAVAGKFIYEGAAGHVADPSLELKFNDNSV